ncbi:MAG: MFS transporter [Clostridia bacterium]|nr:MFS transporter [Clostridia bacterium]
MKSKKAAAQKAGITLVVCAVAYAVCYTGRVNISVASPLLTESGRLSAEAVGAMGSVFFFVYAVGRIVNGIIGDRVPPRFMIALGLSVSAVANTAVGFIPPTALCIVLWGVNGWFLSMLWGASLRATVQNAPDENARKRGAMAMSLAVGGASVVGIAVPLAVTDLGVGYMFFLPGAIMLLAALSAIFFLPRTEAEETAEKPEKLPLDKDAKRGIAFLLVPAAMHGVVKENVMLWAPLFFTQVYGLDIKSASVYIFISPVAALAARLVFPLFYKLCLENEKLCAAVAFVICAAASASFLWSGMPVWFAAAAIGIIMVCASFVNASFLAVFPASFARFGRVSSVSGIMDFASYMGAAAGSLSFGFMAAAAGYRAIMYVWGAISVLSFVICFFAARSRVREAA